MAEREVSVSSLLETLIKNRQIEAVIGIFEAFNEVDLAQAVEELDIADAFFLFKILPKDTAGSLFSYLSTETQEEYVRKWTGPELSSILENVYASDIVDFIDDMPEEIVSKVLKAADSETRADINLLLSYAENSCGSIMTTDYMELEANDTIAKAMSKLKQQGQYAEFLNLCYVVDNFKLVGVISLKHILFANNKSLISDEMDTDLVYVTTSDDQEEATKLMQKYDLSMIPVVDKGQKLVGVITSDDVLDVMEQEATEDIQKMNAITPIDTAYLDSGVVSIAKARLPWLLILMLSASISGYIMGKNTVLLALYPILSSFVPMLMDTAGNAGSQASSMVCRGITIDDLSMKDLGKVLMKELSIAVICGLVLFCVNIVRVMIFMPTVPFMMNISVSTTVFLVVVLAKVIGGFLPLLGTALKVDPAVMASPLITTAVDAMSLTTFFFLASVLL